VQAEVCRTLTFRLWRAVGCQGQHASGAVAHGFGSGGSRWGHRFYAARCTFEMSTSGAAVRSKQFRPLAEGGDRQLTGIPKQSQTCHANETPRPTRQAAANANAQATASMDSWVEVQRAVQNCVMTTLSASAGRGKLSAGLPGLKAVNLVKLRRRGRGYTVSASGYNS
jgi:hypothetical protein